MFLIRRQGGNSGARNQKSGSIKIWKSRNPGIYKNLEIKVWAIPQSAEHKHVCNQSCRLSETDLHFSKSAKEIARNGPSISYGQEGKQKNIGAPSQALAVQIAPRRHSQSMLPSWND